MKHMQLFDWSLIGGVEATDCGIKWRKRPEDSFCLWLHLENFSFDMNNVVNSLLNGFSSMLALGGDAPASDQGGCACAGPEGGSCCKTQQQPKAAAEKDNCACGPQQGPTEIESMKLFYATLTGTAKTFAAELQQRLEQDNNVKIKQLQLVEITDYDNDDLLTETSVCVFLLSCYNVEGPLDWYVYV